MDGEAEGGVGVAWAGARGETVPNGFGVASLGATTVGTTVGAALGAASVESGGAGGGGSDLEEHAAAVVASINACTAKKRRFALISNVSSS